MRVNWWLIAGALFALLAIISFVVLVDSSFTDLRLPRAVAQVPGEVRERWRWAARVRVLSGRLFSASLIGVAVTLPIGVLAAQRRRRRSPAPKVK